MPLPEEQVLKINTLENMMSQNIIDHNEIKKQIASFSEKLDLSLEKMENKFAAKWTEKALVWVGACMGVAFIGLLIRWLVLLDLK